MRICDSLPWCERTSHHASDEPNSDVKPCLAPCNNPCDNHNNVEYTSLCSQRFEIVMRRQFSGKRNPFIVLFGLPRLVCVWRSIGGCLRKRLSKVIRTAPMLILKPFVKDYVCSECMTSQQLFSSCANRLIGSTELL